ncbi:MAG: hypothetical protein AAFR58_21415 [Cyanobacteria bacterium J06627_28]
MMQSKFSQSNFSRSNSSSHFSPHSPQTLEAEFYQITQQKEAQKRDSGSLSVKASLFNFLKTIGSQLVCFLTGTQTLSIRSKRLKNGTVQWMVYDPNTGRCYRFDSETAVRSWLEQRYCR